MDHLPEPHAPHSHGHSHPHDHHGHDHDHDHHHGGSEFYLQQLLTVFICGAFGVAGILMYTLQAGPGVMNDDGTPKTKLGVLLAPQFHIWVLIGSLVLLAVTVVRGISLWRSAGNTHDHHHHDHGHDHHDHHHAPGETCDHPSHTHHHHDNDHGDHSAADHSHGNIYWRVVVLLFPIVLLVMGLPNGTFSDKYLLTRVQGSEVGDIKTVTETGTFEGDFTTIAQAAYSPQSRAAYTGLRATVTGQLKRLSDTQFTLFYFKMTCCTADQVPLKATCVVKNASELAKFEDAQKVKVTGVIQFSETSSGEHITVIDVVDGGLKAVGK